MTSYIINSDNIDNSEIEQIINMFNSDVKFDDYKNLPENTNAMHATAGYTVEPTQIYITANNKLQATGLPKTIYMSFPNTDDKKKDRIVLLDRILHECTHIFQDDSDDRKSKLKLINDYLSKEPDPQRAINTLKAMNFVFNNIEIIATGNFIIKLNPEMNSLPQELSSNEIDLKKMYKEKENRQFSTDIKYLINDYIFKAMEICGSIDKKAILNYIILKAQNEKEAYQNALDSDKELLGITGKTDFDLRIEMYDEIIKAAERLNK